MSITLLHPSQILKGEITLTPSKSESNRALIIQALCATDFDIEHLSGSDDTAVLKKLLNASEKELSVGLAGTTMRFLTALFSIRKGAVILTGEHRMKQRPIKILVDVLRELGAEIEYLEKEGYPPIKIIGKELCGKKITIDGSISSQYISALLMIAPTLKNGLHIKFKGEITSKPYIAMTIAMMSCFKAKVNWNKDGIHVLEGNYIANKFTVESDWSAASYWYSMAALSKNANFILYGLTKEILQGDAAVLEIYKKFGVETEFIKGGIRLKKDSKFVLDRAELTLNFVNYPDIAQTVAVTCAALNISAKLTGLKTLRIKETDRIAALQIELTKLGFSVDVKGDDIIINTINGTIFKFNTPVKTYNDHRMAMAFAPLSLLKKIAIENENVVTKSYPNFWKDLKSIGVEMN